MIRIFFPRQNVPSWLEKVEATGVKKPISFKFGSICVVAKYRGSYFIWHTMLFGNNGMVITGECDKLVITGGGKGVFLSPDLPFLLRTARRASVEQKGGAA